MDQHKVEAMAQHGVEALAQHGVEAVAQHGVEDVAQHGVENVAQHAAEDMVHQDMKQQHRIQIMPFQKLQEPGRQMRNHKVYCINIGKHLVPQSHLMMALMH